MRIAHGELQTADLGPALVAQLVSLTFDYSNWVRNLLRTLPSMLCAEKMETGQTTKKTKTLPTNSIQIIIFNLT